MNIDVPAPGDMTGELNQYVRLKVPGLQYLAVTAERVLHEHTGGWADIQGQKAMKPETTLMAYSMTKTFTSVAILQLAEREKLRLDEVIDCYLPNNQYRSHGITLRQLLNHTSGAPHPIPLRWAHLAVEESTFSEAEALATVLRQYPDLAFEPGRKFAYSNIGYWLLGKVIERVTGERFSSYVSRAILRPLGLTAKDMGFVIPDVSLHANGYLKKYSLMNLMKGFVIDRKYVGDYEGHWLRLKNHYLNGPAFGGLIGTARGFSRFLQDQLRAESVLFSPQTKCQMESQQSDSSGRPIPMTLGWHLGESNGIGYFFKEGGGGGFHCEMRIYPTRGIATVALANSTGFRSTAFLNRFDRTFLESRR